MKESACAGCPELGGEGAFCVRYSKPVRSVNSCGRHARKTFNRPFSANSAVKAREWYEKHLVQTK